MSAKSDLQSAVDFSAAFADFNLENCARILVAVSGGSDSMALLTGLHTWLAEQRSACALIAATVDHQLRPESKVEARQMAAFCDSRGIRHFTMKWDHAGIENGIQQKARMARYELLARLAVEQGVDLVLTGHTLDDQLETIAMRQQRGQGRGEAGIAPASCYQRSIWFARPLLQTRREALRHYLRSANVAWLDDPSNDNKAFERVRVRKTGTGSVDQSVIEQAQIARRKDCQLAADLLSDDAVFSTVKRDSGVVSVEAIGRRGLAPALACILSVVGEKAHFPGAAALRQAMHFMEMQTTSARQNNAKLTLHGCLLTHHDGLVVVEREVRNCGGGYFGMDKLVPSFDEALANALYARLGETLLPPFASAIAPY